ncbi:MAG TPA: PD-(D/E)XK nuclease family protein [Longimicrobiales bacterium]
MPRALAALAAAAAAHPYERKLLVCRRAGIGRELLRALAARGCSWIGFEVTTPVRLAQELVEDELAAEGLKVSDGFDELSLLDAAIDAVLDRADGRLADLAEGVGLRQAVARSVQALRMGGIDAPALERARFRDEDKRAQIARILDEYERRLRESGRVDRARIFARAAARLGIGAAAPSGCTYLVTGQSTRGLEGRFLDALIERGAEVLDADPVFGLRHPEAWLAGAIEPPDDALRAGATPLSWLHDVAGWARTANADSASERAGADVVLDVFAATSVSTELREVLRRIMAAGLQWDEVEIIATDANVYGVALDALAQRLGVPVSYAAGLPVTRTRPGRAVAKYLEWVEQGFPADVLRQMLERGDIASPDRDVTGVALARRLRSLRIGRGRERYESALARRERIIEAPQSAEDERTPQEYAEDRAREAAEIAALSRVVRPLLDATPAVPARTGVHDVLVSPADLARGLLVLVELVPGSAAVDEMARAEMRIRLERIATSLTRATTLSAAIAVLTTKLSARVPAPEADGGSPWTSTGGHLHLSDLEHGGFAARRATFVVGLDAARFPGAGGGDALLVDDDRRRLTAGQQTPALPTAAERIEERRHAFGAMVARLRGRVTFSYATWDAVEGRGVAPAAELLQAYRLLSGDPAADYEALHAAAAPAASAVPRGTALLDADDVWLNALAHNGALRRGVTAVCATYPHLEAGVTAWKTRLRSDSATPFHGAITPRPQLDPRDNALRVVSPTQLQALGSCAHRYLLRYVLRVKKPDDPQISPEQWLPPIEKGALMHAVYERSLGAVLERGIPIDDPAFETFVLEILDEEIERWRDRLPPPGGAVFTAECAALREDARAFVAMVRDDGARFIALERKFGRDAAPPVPIALPDGRVIHLNGAIDRVDRLDDGRLVVIDYKTGSSLRYGGKSGTYDGGRRLQHVLYTEAARRLFDAEVARAEYHFPTRRAENHRASYTREELRDGLALVADLLELVANGWFIPTNQSDDCRFCDFAQACRVSVDAYGKVDSPLADWSREASGDSADLLRRIRR